MGRLVSTDSKQRPLPEFVNMVRPSGFIKMWN